MLSVAKLTFSRNDKPNRHAYHDVGLAVSQLIVQASALGLRVHQMAGFDVDKARETYVIPEGFDPVAAIAIGYSGEEMLSSRTRRPQDETAFSGSWGEAY
jgi:nitroreductase